MTNTAFAFFMTETSIEETNKKRLTPDEWSEACQLWQTGDYTLDALSKQFGVSQTAFHRRFVRHGIVKGSQRQVAETALNEQLKLQSEAKAKELASGFYNLRDFCFKLNSSIASRVANELANAAKDKKDLSLIKDSMKTLEIAQGIVSKAFESAKSMAGKALAEDDDDTLPSLHVVPMTREDIEDLRRRQEEEEAEMYGLDDEKLDAIEDLK